MYQSIGKITLHSGEQVDFGIVRAPDDGWRDRIVKMFVPKGVLWQWQNAEALSADVGIRVSYFLLHRDGQPFANVMLMHYSGVGMLQHVWTDPEDRGQGASSLLVNTALEDFRSNGGQALFLETGYGSSAYHIYERLGFHSIEPGSRHMEYYATSKREFDQAYFAPGRTEIELLAWRHWITSQALFTGDFPSRVRCAALQMIGRAVNDEYIIPLISDDLLNPPAEKRARVLTQPETSAMVGFALWSWHPFWPGRCVIDLFCHPAFQNHADDLLASLTLPQADRLIAYTDAHDAEKADFLRRHGFRQTAVLPGQIAVDAAKSASLDVLVFEK